MPLNDMAHSRTHIYHINITLRSEALNTYLIVLNYLKLFRTAILLYIRKQKIPESILSTLW